MSKVDEVSRTIAELKEGKIDVQEAVRTQARIDSSAKEDERKRQQRARTRIEEALVNKAKEEDHAVLMEVHKDKVDELKRDYYHRKNRRERWEEYRKTNPSRVMDYRGWDLFEEDPDEELWEVQVRRAFRGSPRARAPWVGSLWATVPPLALCLCARAG